MQRQVQPRWKAIHFESNAPRGTLFKYFFPINVSRKAKIIWYSRLANNRGRWVGQDIDTTRFNRTHEPASICSNIICPIRMHGGNDNVGSCEQRIWQIKGAVFEDVDFNAMQIGRAHV